MDILTGKKMLSIIGQFVHPRGGDRLKGVDGGIVILASSEKYFIRVQENLVQHPSNDISITKLKHYSTSSTLK